MQPFILIFVCGGLGCVARYALTSAIVPLLPRTGTWSGFPVGTLAVNWLGALLIGAVMAWGAFRFDLNLSMRYALVTGFLGGFTAFSAFSLETMLMLTKGQYGLAALYISLSVAGTIALAFMGSLLARGLI